MSTATTLARPYAQALFQIAGRSAEEMTSISEGLSLLASVSLEPGVAALLRLPDQKASAKAAALTGLLKDSLSARVARLLKVLADNSRLQLLPAIQEVFEALKKEAEDVLDVEITSAFPLSRLEIETLQSTLAKHTGRSVEIKADAIQVSDALIGGVVIRAGGRLIDASVRGRLQQLEKELASA